MNFRTRVRCEVIILIWGYGGDAAELMRVMPSIIMEGFRSLLDPDYAREILGLKK